MQVHQKNFITLFSVIIINVFIFRGTMGSALVAAAATDTSSCACSCPAESEEETQQTSFVNTVRLYELYPSPNTDEEEFIELYNTGTAGVDLAGWALADASGKKYVISADDFTTTALGGGSYFVVPQSASKIYLNNSGDSVLLYQPDGTLLDETTYEDADKGLSWSLFDKQWKWSAKVTANVKNMDAPVEENKNDATSAEQGDNSDSKNSDEQKNDDATAAFDPSKLESSDKIMLNELLPNPAGLDSTDEWIEIANTGSATVYLGGWQLTDENDYYAFGDFSIGGGEYLMFDIAETKITLNNSDDQLYLIDPFGTIVQGVGYEDAAEGSSWARFESGWEWTSDLTPGEANIASGVENEEGDDENNEEEESDPDVVAISYFRTLEDDQSATIEGVVTVLPNVFGSQYMYIQDDEAGVQVYSYSKAFPELQVGDRIRVTGQKSTSRNEVRLKSAAAEDFEIISSGVEVTPRDVTELEESLEGMLVQTEGHVVESSSSYAIIDDRIKIVFKSGANIDLELFAEGKNIAVIGVVGQYDEEYRLMPRSNDDVAELDEGGLELVPGAAAASTVSNASYELAPVEQKTKASKTTIFLVVVMVGLSVVIISMVVRQRWEQLTKKFGILNKFFLKRAPSVSGESGKKGKEGETPNTKQEIPTIFDLVKRK